MAKHVPGLLHEWVANQDKVWIDVKGKEHKIEKIELSYLKNILAFYERHAYRYFAANKNKLSDWPTVFDWTRQTALHQALILEIFKRELANDDYEV